MTSWYLLYKVFRIQAFNKNPPPVLLVFEMKLFNVQVRPKEVLTKTKYVMILFQIIFETL